MQGTFIVFEGIDGAGTTTQTKLFVDALVKKGIPTHSTNEPSSGPVGCLLRQCITGRLLVPGKTGPKPPSWAEMALLFAADRLDHLESEILLNLNDGITVVTDRYYHSSYAYQTLTSGKDPNEIFNWIKDLNVWARKPDLTFILDVPSSEASKRRNLRLSGIELFDDNDLQNNLAMFYKNMDKYLPEENIIIIDNLKPAEEVHKECFSIYEEYLKVKTS